MFAEYGSSAYRNRHLCGERGGLKGTWCAVRRVRGDEEQDEVGLFR